MSKDIHKLFLTPAMIMSWEPCHEWPLKRVTDAFMGRTKMLITTLLRRNDIDAEDRLWVVLRKDVLSPKMLRLFACDCTERALLREREQGHEPDPRSWAAVEVARRFARGEATVEELEAARGTDAGGVAWSIVEDSVMNAAWDAAWDAARDAAWDSVGTTARAAAWDTERQWQIEHIIEMIEAERMVIESERES